MRKGVKPFFTYSMGCENDGGDKNALYCVYRQGAFMNIFNITNYKDKIQEDDNIEKEL